MDLSDTAQFWINLFFLWTGFGIVVGMTAQVILPSGEPKGTFGILVIGVTGSCLGPFLASLIWKQEHFNPIGPVGFFISVLVTLGILILYRFAIALRKKRT
jgi:uncharacterized membrane protein YeaQ/YmgE (transglycosylase-associated protein family)